jgi:hypothetical protein
MWQKVIFLSVKSGPEFGNSVTAGIPFPLSRIETMEILRAVAGCAIEQTG